MSDLLSLSNRFNSKEKCLEYFEKLRFPNGVECPRCESKSISRLTTRHQFTCLKCRYRFSVTAGTIFHKTHIPLQKWIIACFLICNARKGISAKQIERDLKVSYETAWSMMHRIRRAMRDSDLIKKLKGIVEADETYVGGKMRGGKGGRGSENKLVVLGAIERKGRVRAQLSKNASIKNISQFIRQNVSTNARMLVTDEFLSYRPLKKDYNHWRINHKKHYVDGVIHTQNMENLWSILKRGIIGIYHKVSAKYLILYLDEFTFRFNNRECNPLFEKVITNGLAGAL